MLHGRQDWTSSSKPINFHPTDHSPSNSSESLSSSSISSSLSSSSSSSSSGSSTDVLHKTSLPDWVTPAYTSSSLPSRSRGSVEAALINSHHVLDRAVCGKATSIRSPFEWTTLLNALKRLEIKGLLQRTEPPNKGNPHNTYQTNHQTSGKTGSRETRRRRDVKGKGKETSSLSIAASKSLDRLLSRLSLLLERSNDASNLPFDSESSYNKLKAINVHSREYKRSLQADEARALSKVIQLCRPILSNSYNEESHTSNLKSNQPIPDHLDRTEETLADLLSKLQLPPDETLYDMTNGGPQMEVLDPKQYQVLDPSLLTSIEGFYLTPSPSRDLVIFMSREKPAQDEDLDIFSAGSHLDLFQSYAGGAEEMTKSLNGVARLAIIEEFETLASWRQLLSALIPYLTGLETLFVNSSYSSTPNCSKTKIKSSILSSRLNSVSLKSQVPQLPPSITALGFLSLISIHTTTPRAQPPRKVKLSKQIARELYFRKTKCSIQRDAQEEVELLPSLLSMAVEASQAFIVQQTSSSTQTSHLLSLPPHLSRLVRESSRCASCKRFILSTSHLHLPSFIEIVSHLHPPLPLRNALAAAGASSKDVEELESASGRKGARGMPTLEQTLKAASNRSKFTPVRLHSDGWRFCSDCAPLHLFSQSMREKWKCLGVCECSMCRKERNVLQEGEGMRWWRERWNKMSTM